MNDTNEMNEIVKVLTKLTIEDKQLFLEFIRRIASEETTDTTELVASSPQTETKIP